MKYLYGKQHNDVQNQTDHGCVKSIAMNTKFTFGDYFTANLRIGKNGRLGLG